MNNLIGKFVGMWTRPWSSMQEVKQEGENASAKPSMVFIIVMGLISGLITALVGLVQPAAGFGGSKAMVWLSVLIVPLVSFLGSFIGALIIWGLVDGFLRGTSGGYWTSYRILALLAAFSPVSAALSAIPKVGQYLAIAVNIWATIVMIRGIIIVRDTPPVRTWVTCGILFALLFTLGIFARLAAQRQLQGGANPDFTNFGLDQDFGDEELGEADDLDKQLQELAEQTKTEKPKP